MPVNQARNEAELQALIMPQLKEAVDYLVQKIWNDNKELVRVIVYEAYQPTEYERTGEFKEAWSTEVKSTKNVVQGEFHYDPRKLTAVQGAGQHCSLADSTPMTQYLAEIIYEGLSGAIYQPGYAHDDAIFEGQAWTKKRNAWEELIKRLGKERFRKYFEEGMRQAGINFQRRAGAIKKVEYYG